MSPNYSKCLLLAPVEAPVWTLSVATKEPLINVVSYERVLEGETAAIKVGVQNWGAKLPLAQVT